MYNTRIVTFFVGTMEEFNEVGTSEGITVRNNTNNQSFEAKNFENYSKHF